MALSERISEEDLIVYEVLRHPVLCGEFINNIDRLEYEEPFEFTSYQKEMLCDFNPYVSLCCGRAIGKTVALVNTIIWILINNIFPNDYVLYSVPNKVHLEPVFTGLIRSFRSNSLLKYFINTKEGINSSDYKITLLNTAVLLCRIAGQSGSGANVVGLHTPFEILDEAGYYPWGTWIEQQPTLNTFTNGFRMIVSGVPTGLRENNILFSVDQTDSSYTKHRISALKNPRFSKEDEEKAALQYGGRDSEEYAHLVNGEHGKPIFSLFDRGLMEISTYPVYKIVIDGIKMSENLGEYISKISLLPPIPDKNYKCLFGIDLGYTEATAIFVLYIDNYGRIKFHGKIKMTKVAYNVQEKLIDYLDSKFDPYIIGIDEGAAGKATIHHLIGDVQFTHKNYSKKIIPINFSSWISLGIDSNGQEIKNKAKPVAVSVLQEYSNNHKIIYTHTDLEMITELERMTYSKTTSGEIVYKTLTDRGGKKGEDHFTSALLCAALAYYLTHESLINTRKPKLFTSRWVF